MIFLTAAELAEVVRLINDHHAALAVSMFGPAAGLDAAEVARLTAAGLVQPGAADFIAGAYELGQVAALLRPGEAGPGSAAEAQEAAMALAARPPLARLEQAALDAARAHAAQLIVGLGNRVAADFAAEAIEADARLRARLREELRAEVAEGVERRRTAREVASAMGHRTEDWARDFDRIAQTELVSARNEGAAAEARRRGGKFVARQPAPDACPWCRRFYLDHRGTPRIFELAELERNGLTNHGRKREAWLPVVGATHPHCQCSFVAIPEGWVFDDLGLLAPKEIAEKSGCPHPGLAKAGTSEGARRGWEHRHRGSLRTTMLGLVQALIAKHPGETDEQIARRARKLLEHGLASLSGTFRGADWGATAKATRAAGIADALLKAIPVGSPQAKNRLEHQFVGTVRWRGLTIDVENRKGSTRRGVDADGHRWATKMRYDYGEIRRVRHAGRTAGQGGALPAPRGADDEKVDVYLGPDERSDRVFVVHQSDPATGRYDEDKVMLAFSSAAAARRAYLRQYDRPGFFGGMDELSIGEFRAFLLDRRNLGKKIRGKQCHGKPREPKPPSVRKASPASYDPPRSGVDGGGAHGDHERGSGGSKSGEVPGDARGVHAPGVRPGVGDPGVPAWVAGRGGRRPGLVALDGRAGRPVSRPPRGAPDAPQHRRVPEGDGGVGGGGRPDSPGGHGGGPPGGLQGWGRGGTRPGPLNRNGGAQDAPGRAIAHATVPDPYQTQEDRSWAKGGAGNGTPGASRDPRPGFGAAIDDEDEEPPGGEDRRTASRRPARATGENPLQRQIRQAAHLSRGFSKADPDEASQFTNPAGYWREQSDAAFARAARLSRLAKTQGEPPAPTRLRSMAFPEPRMVGPASAGLTAGSLTGGGTPALRGLPIQDRRPARDEECKRALRTNQPGYVPQGPAPKDITPSGPSGRLDRDELARTTLQDQRARAAHPQPARYPGTIAEIAAITGISASTAKHRNYLGAADLHALRGEPAPEPGNPSEPARRARRRRKSRHSEQSDHAAVSPTSPHHPSAHDGRRRALAPKAPTYPAAPAEDPSRHPAGSSTVAKADPAAVSPSPTSKDPARPQPSAENRSDKTVGLITIFGANEHQHSAASNSVDALHHADHSVAAAVTSIEFVEATRNNGKSNDHAEQQTIPNAANETSTTPRPTAPPNPSTGRPWAAPGGRPPRDRARARLPAGAFAHTRGGRIRLRADLAPEAIPAVLRHEFGHAALQVVSRKLGRRTPEWLAGLYRLAAREGWVTEYASRNAAENAASLAEAHLFDRGRLVGALPRQAAAIAAALAR